MGQNASPNYEGGAAEVHMEHVEHCDAVAELVAAEPAVTEDVEGKRLLAEAEELLRAPDLLERFVSDVHAGGFVGEDKNLKLLKLVETSRLLDKPLGAVVKATAGSGKSELVRQALRRSAPVHEVDEFTPHALDSMGDVRNRVLYLTEAARINKAASQLRVLISEGRLVTRDHRSERRCDGPVAFITTTTALHVEPELESRLLELTLDESREQNRRIVSAKCTAAGEWGLDRVSYDEQTRVWQIASGLLMAKPVAIPDLERHLPPEYVACYSARRGVEKLIGLISAHTVLHQRRREERGGCLIATDEDIAACLELFQDHFGTVPPVLLAIETALKAQFANRDFTVTEAAAALDRNPDVLRRWIKELADLGRLEQPGKSMGRRGARWKMVNAVEPMVAAPPDSTHEFRTVNAPTVVRDATFAGDRDDFARAA